MWRHGDVLVMPAPGIPAQAKRRPGAILVRGELSGHSHRVAEPDSAELWELGGVLYLKVTADSARLIHEEHQPITLPRGTYRVWQQREYTPHAIRTVAD